MNDDKNQQAANQQQDAEKQNAGAEVQGQPKPDQQQEPSNGQEAGKEEVKPDAQGE